MLICFMAVESSKEFNRISQEYDQGRVSEDIYFWAGEASRLAGLNSNSLIVDVGCGTGNYGIGIKVKTHATVVGFDPVPGMLAQAREKAPDFPVIRAVTEKIPFRGDVFDLSYAAQVWHHIQGRQEAAHELSRILKLRGCHIAHTISHLQLNEKIVFKFFPEIKANQLRVYPSDDEFTTIFRKAGFKTVEVYPYNVERYQSVDEFIEIAEKKLWSMFRPITEDGLKKGVVELKKWKKEQNDAPVRNDEMISLFIARK